MTSTIELSDRAATATVAQAQAVIHAGHRRLLGALRPKVALLVELDLSCDAREAAWDALADFCSGAVRHHLAASDQALYTPAAGEAETRLLIEALRTGADALTGQIDALARANDADTAGTIAQHIEAVLAVHLAVEQAVLLPVLTALPGADLPALAAYWTALLHESPGGTKP